MGPEAEFRHKPTGRRLPVDRVTLCSCSGPPAPSAQGSPQTPESLPPLRASPANSQADPRSHSRAACRKQPSPPNLPCEELSWSLGPDTELPRPGPSSPPPLLPRLAESDHPKAQGSEQAVGGSRARWGPPAFPRDASRPSKVLQLQTASQSLREGEHTPTATCSGKNRN